MDFRQHLITLDGCVDPRQQGYGVQAPAPAHTVAHVFTGEVRTYNKAEGNIPWGQPTHAVTALTADGEFEYTWRTGGSSVIPPQMLDGPATASRGEVYLLTGQSVAAVNGLYMVIDVARVTTFSIPGWSGFTTRYLYTNTLRRLDVDQIGRNDAILNANFRTDYSQSVNDLRGAYPGATYTTTGQLLQMDGTPPTLSADGNTLTFELPGTYGEREAWYAVHAAKILSDRYVAGSEGNTQDGEPFDSHPYVRTDYPTEWAQVYVKFIAVDAAHGPAGTWREGLGFFLDNVVLTWTRAEEPYARLDGEFLYISGSRVVPVPIPGETAWETAQLLANDSMEAMIGGGGGGVLTQSTASFCFTLANQSSPELNGTYLLDRTSSVYTGYYEFLEGTWGGFPSSFLEYYKFKKLPVVQYDLAGRRNLSLNISSTQGEWWAAVTSPDDATPVTWALGAEAQLFRAVDAGEVVVAHHISNFKGIDGRAIYQREGARDRHTGAALDADRLEFLSGGSARNATMTTAEFAEFMKHASGAVRVFTAGEFCLFEAIVGAPVGAAGLWEYHGEHDASTPMQRLRFQRTVINARRPTSSMPTAGDVWSAKFDFSTSLDPISATPDQWVTTPEGYLAGQSVFPAMSAVPTNHVVQKDALVFAPATSSGVVQAQSDMHANKAEIVGSVFYAAHNSSRADYATLVARGLTVYMHDIATRGSFSLTGSGDETTHRPGVRIPLEAGTTFSRVHRTSMQFDLLDLKQKMEWEFVYSDTGRKLSDAHARVVGRVHLTLNFRGFPL